MITRFAMTTSRWALSLAIIMTLAACGGGGGGGGGNKDDDGFLGNGGGSGSSDAYYLSLSLVDEDGEDTNTISGTDSATARAVVTRNGPNGKPVTDVVVSFSADIGVLLPASATALTDEEGIATILLASDGVLGAGTLGASVDSPSGPVTTELTYQVDFSDVQLGYFQGEAFIPGEIGIGTSTLGSGGSTLLTVSLVDADGEGLGQGHAA